jgi:hypothetical protein
MKKSTAGKKYVAYVAIALCLHFIVAGIIYFCVSHYLAERKVFTPEKWNNDIWSREYMLDDLYAKYDLIGMHKTDVEKLLGNNGEVSDDHYYVGKGWIGPVILILTYDESDLLVKYDIIVD